MTPANAEVRKLSPRGMLVKAGLLVLLMPVGLSAPEVMGTLRGRITDGSGAPVVKALIAVISAHGKVRLATSNARGDYAVSDIEPGLYTIWVTEGNVSRFDRANLGSTHGQVETIDITLAVGSGRRRRNLPLLVQPPTELAFLEKGTRNVLFLSNEPKAADTADKNFLTSEESIG
jgi:Carboxypeptidase regulatory-like domain